MRWQGRRRSQNVEDRRGQRTRRIPRGGRPGGVRRASGGSVVLFLAIAVLLWIFAGVNPLQLINIIAQQDGGPVISAPSQQRSPQQTAADDQRAQFMSVVLAETEDAWGNIFAANNARYDPPKLILYSGFTQSGCGLGQAAVGPFYCPLDRSVYIDLSFFDMLDRRFGAPGDFAQAYVLAHEVGHHVQNLRGILGEYHQRRQRGLTNNIDSIRIELQADCYAGVWAHVADRSGIVEEGDIDEALGAAAAVGDDMLQRREQGYAVPESFNHGTSEQRSRWFRIGYQSGDFRACNTQSSTRL